MAESRVVATGIAPASEAVARLEAARPVRHRHMPELQSIRGIAAMVVLAGHTTGYFVMPAWFITIQTSVANGEGAVVVFFVLSGFVLTNLLTREPVTAKRAAVFYVRRLFRIYPALWAASALALIYVAFLHWRIPVADTSAWFQQRFKVERFTTIGLLASFAGALAFLLPPVWTIFAELVGSLLMPLIVRAGDRRAWFLGLGAVLGLISFTIGASTYYGVAVYMFDFWIGSAAFFALRRDWRILSPPRWLGVALTLAASSSFFWGQFAARSQHDPIEVLFYALAATFIIIGVARDPGGVAWLRSKPLTNLGDWSYSLYLFHFPIMCFIAKGMQLTGATALDPLARGMLLFVLTAVAAVGVSAVTYRLLETPGIALGNEVVRRLRLWRPTTSEQVG